MLLHGKSVMSLLLSIVGRARPLAQAPDAALSHPWLQRGETGTTLNTRPNVQYLHTRYRHWRVKRTSYSWEQAVCFSAYLGSPDSSHCLPPLSRLWAWYWLRHALSGSRRPDTGTDVFSDNTTTQREQQKWGNLREDNRTSTPCIFSPLLYWSFPEWPAVSDMDWI